MRLLHENSHHHLNYQNKRQYPGSIQCHYLKNKYPHGINALPEIPTVTQAGTIDLEKIKNEMTYKVCWLGIDPRLHDSDAGFVAKLQLNLK